jgi:quercetin dioxygenase-like cupin family protein
MLLSTLGSVMGLLVPRRTAAAQSGPPSTPNFSPGADVSRLWVGPIVVAVRADSALTSGHYGLVENLARPGAGVPLHVHSKEDETLCLIAGALEVTVGDLQRVARAGDVVYMPRNIPHRFQNGGNQPARMLIVFSPGGFERGFFEVGRPIRGADDVPPVLTPEELQRVRAVAEHYGVRWI